MTSPTPPLPPADREPEPHSGAGQSGAEGRIQPRDSLFLMARLTVGEGGTPHDARVRNLSEGGLMADYAPPVAVGERVWLELRGIGAITGRIAWVEAQRIGVAFDHPVDPRLARKPVGQGTHTPYYAKQAVIGLPPKAPPRR